MGETSNVVDLGALMTDITTLKLAILVMKLLSSTKIFLAFSSNKEAEKARDMSSPLWDYFNDVDLRFEGLRFDERFVWLECFGIPLHQWCKVAFKNIGSIWVPIIEFNSQTENTMSLTRVRMLLRTKVTNEWIVVFY